jgi:hypothetical protein
MDRAMMVKLAVVAVAVAGLGACQSIREAAGGTKTVPDEFRVVAKAPLVVPPEFNLRPPRPGEARPLELQPDLQARSAVFGVQLGATASEGERALIAQMGASNADPRVRDVVDDETGNLARKPRGIADRLLGHRAPAGAADAPAPLTAEQEAERLRAEQRAITNATGGRAPTIQQSSPRGFKLPGM